jgi:hypothetical protein
MAAGINHRTNYALLSALALAMPALNLVLVGPLAPVTGRMHQQREHLLALPNVFHVDTQHPDELRHIIGGACSGLVAYAFEQTKEIPTLAGGTPLKVLTYLAQHCPVISSINSCVPELDGRGVFKAENEEEFIRLVADITSKKLKTDMNTTSSYLDRVTYDRLVTCIWENLVLTNRVSKAKMT